MEKWGYTAIFSDGSSVMADSMEELQKKISQSGKDVVIIFHHEDSNSTPDFKTIIVIDYPQPHTMKDFGIIAKCLGKTINDIEKML